MKRGKHPTPWRVERNGSNPAVWDRDGGDSRRYGYCWTAEARVIDYGVMLRDQAERIARAVNAYESPVARCERAVVRAAVEWAKARRVPRQTYEGPLHKAVDRLLAARKRARGAK